MIRSLVLALPLLLLAGVATAHGQDSCVGDCNGNGVISVAELVMGVSVAVGAVPIEDCSAILCNGEERGPLVNCCVWAVNNALGGDCGGF